MIHGARIVIRHNSSTEQDLRGFPVPIGFGSDSRKLRKIAPVIPEMDRFKWEKF